MSEDWNLMLSAFGIIVVVTGITQILSKKYSGLNTILRKVLHFAAIVICAYVILNVDHHIVLATVFILLALILSFVVKYKLLNISQGNSYGIALFPLSFGCLLLLESLSADIVTVSALVLAIADPLASIVGQRFAQNNWYPLFEKKSWLGSLTFFIATILILPMAEYFVIHSSLKGLSLAAIVGIAFLTTLAEMFSWRGSDNFFIPVVVCLAFQAHFLQGLELSVGIGIMVLLLGYFLYRLEWLKLSGVLAMTMMTMWIVMAINVKALILPIIFLVVGSLLSRLNKGDQSIAPDDTKGRNAIQVFANGGWGMIVGIPYLLTYQDIYLLLYVLVFCTALADTASSEVGRYFKGMTYDLKSLQKVVPGVSGGVSMKGTAVGMIASIFMSLLAAVIFELSRFQVSMIALLGFTGMMIDSFIGAYLQGKYLVHGLLAEDGRPDQLISGYHWIDNSMVNFLSIGIISIMALLFLQ